MAGQISWRELFPSKLSLIIFVVYILLFVNQGILVTASQGSNSEYDYNIVTVVLLTEVLKLIISATLYCRDAVFNYSIATKTVFIRSLINSLSVLLNKKCILNRPLKLVQEVIENKKVLCLYFVPAFLYCLYNNLAFVNLSSFDPTTYYLLLQFRVVVTGVLFQVIFSKTLSKKQWLSLFILTFGCMLKQVNFNQSENEEVPGNKSYSLTLGANAIFILVQIVCSCLAGVYNEYLLKREGHDINIFIQNVFMYLDSIVCNLVLLIINGNIQIAFDSENIVKVLHFKVLFVMLNNAAVGIVTSFFLKTLNSILKTFASALELALTALLSYVFFGIPIYLNTALSILIVMYAIYLYSQNPVQTPLKDANKVDTEETLELVKSEEV